MWLISCKLQLLRSSQCVAVLRLLQSDAIPEITYSQLLGHLYHCQYRLTQSAHSVRVYIIWIICLSSLNVAVIMAMTDTDEWLQMAQEESKRQGHAVMAHSPLEKKVTLTHGFAAGSSDQ